VCAGAVPALLAGFERFLIAARPPLEAMIDVYALVNGRTFPRVVAALRDAHPCPDKFLELETQEYIGGPDPLGLLAAAFPRLEVLIAPRMYGSQSLRPERLSSLRQDVCIFPTDRHEQLYGSFRICEAFGEIMLSITSDHHGGFYSADGVSWAGMEHLCGQTFLWDVGRGVTHEQVLEFLYECGIEHRADVEIDLSPFESDESEGDESGEDEFRSARLPGR